MSFDAKEIIRGANRLRKVKIRYSRSKTGNLNLYLEYCHDQLREREFLGITLTGLPNDRMRDENNLRIALQRRDDLEKVVMSGGTLRADKHIPFIDYAHRIAAQKKAPNRVAYSAAISHFSKYAKDYPASEITPQMIKAFTRSLGALSPNTRNHYIFALRHICDKAIEDGMLERNPFSGIKKEKVTTNKEFLTLEEIKFLMTIPCKYEDVKRSFLFACFTGLRYGDVSTITAANISGGYLSWKQHKTGTHERILIPDIAMQYAPEPRYHLPTYETVNDTVKEWVIEAGIDRKITFHCARHTFATLCITLGVDIYTVSKLLGHSDVRITQQYAKLVDEKKDQAARTISKVFL